MSRFGYGVNDLTGHTNSYGTEAAATTVASGTYTFNFNNGMRQKITATGSFTLAFSGFRKGVVQYAVIEAVNWGAYTITLPSGLASITPTFTISGVDLLCIEKSGSDKYRLIGVRYNVGAGA